jgi:hypothetical protein
MDETMMNLRIDWVLIPWKNMMNPVIVLNAYGVYMMGSIENHKYSTFPVDAGICANQSMLE